MCCGGTVFPVVQKSNGQGRGSKSRGDATRRQNKTHVNEYTDVSFALAKSDPVAPNVPRYIIVILNRINLKYITHILSSKFRNIDSIQMKMLMKIENKNC